MEGFIPIKKRPKEDVKGTKQPLGIGVADRKAPNYQGLYTATNGTLDKIPRMLPITKR